MDDNNVLQLLVSLIEIWLIFNCIAFVPNEKSMHSIKNFLTLPY